MRFTSSLAIAAVASFLLVGTASAQAPASPSSQPSTTQKTAPAEKMAPADKKAEKPRTAASLECSKQADAKGLHGTERRKFRSDCKKSTKTN